MKYGIRSFLNILVFLFSVNLCAQSSTDKNVGTLPTYRVSGDAVLLSQFIDRGLALSDRNPALNASFLFNLGSQFRLGFWGSNISNVSASDDNFWFRILAEIRITFNDKAFARVYINDDRFYKSDIRNGQRTGVFFDYELTTLQIEWQGNYEGTQTAAQYVNFGKAFAFKKDFKAGAKLGYVWQKTTWIDDYLDAKIYVNYQLTSNATFEVGGTGLSSNQFGSRGELAAYLALGLNY